MKNYWLKQFLRLAGLVLLQVLVLNNINLGGYVHPAVYLLFVLLLPVNMGKNLVMFLAFLSGLTIDYFGNTMGLHAAASVLMAFARPGVLDLFFKPIEFGKNEEAGIFKVGIGGFLRYALVLTFIHHSALFILETLDFSDFHLTILRILFSTAVSTVGMLVLLMVFGKNN